MAFENFALFGVVLTWVKPLWIIAAGAAGVVVLLAIIVLALRQWAPKVAAVASTTATEAFSQPLFYVLLALGIVALLLFPFIPYNTLGEDIKMVKDGGLTLMIVLSIMMSIWTASVSVSDEIEGRIALTLLSKPIGRRQFIFGKFLGIMGAVAVMFVILGALFLATLSYKFVYDARESSLPEPAVADCQAEIVQMAPAVALAFMEAVVITAIGIAIATRLGVIPNLLLCLAIFGVSHLMPTLVQAAGAHPDRPIPLFLAQLLATVLPMLDAFNITTSITKSQFVPWSYLGWATVYCVLYTTVAMLLALLLFEDRDLA